MNFKAQSRFTGLNKSVAQAVFEQAARLSVEQGAEAVLETAESIVPVETGDLRESGHVELLKGGAQPSAAVVFDSPHAGYVEYGTGIRGAASAGAGDGPYSESWPGMRAQPYLRPSLDIERPHIVEIFRENTAIAARTLGET
jgi:HK97 gp10 family phage protein